MLLKEAVVEDPRVLRTSKKSAPIIAIETFDSGRFFCPHFSAKTPSLGRKMGSKRFPDSEALGLSLGGKGGFSQTAEPVARVQRGDRACDFARREFAPLDLVSRKNGSCAVPAWLILIVGQNMKRFALIFLASILSCGFLVQTPAEREKIERRVREWKKDVSSRYDLDALTQFLQATVVAKKTWDGVDLTKPRIGSKWEFGGCCMNSGDWTFTAADPKTDEFSLQFSV